MSSKENDPDPETPFILIIIISLCGGILLGGVTVVLYLKNGGPIIVRPVLLQSNPQLHCHQIPMKILIAETHHMTFIRQSQMKHTLLLLLNAYMLKLILHTNMSLMYRATYHNVVHLYYAVLVVEMRGFLS